ncbi:MAG TPA: hypothetical protein VK615_04465 [Candidatus Binatia bacterium]|nr:hypothetical protein [Candidatus Binatia bacterium]
MKKILNVLGLLGFLVPGVFAQNNPPVINCPQPVTVEATSSNGAVVNLTASVSDVDSNALTVVWMVDGAFSLTNDLAAGTAAAVDVAFSAEFGLGVHEVVVLVSDGGGVVSCTNQVTVGDTTPPAVQRVTATPNVLWPPNHKMRPIRITVEGSDASGTATAQIVSVTSSEPDRGTCTGDAAIDWVIGPGPLDLMLRAERSGRSKNGRIYTITVQVSDAAGNSTTQTVTVTVPHDQGKKGKPAKPAKPCKPAKGKKGGKKK